jgi:hypothetical protein
MASIDIGQFDALFGGILNGFGQFFDVGAFLLVGRRHGQRQQVTQRIHRHSTAMCTLLPLRRL